MIIPAAPDLWADRWTPFVATLNFTGAPSLSGATLAMQIRSDFDAPGSPLVSLAGVGSPASQGIYIASATQLGIRINEATMEAMPDAAEVGENLELKYDIHITPSGAVKQVWLRGKFIIRGGATQ